MTAACLEYTGTLTRAAEVRARVQGVQTVPVVCFEIDLENSLRNRMHIEQPFAAGHHAEAETAARQLRKGARITVRAPAIDMQLVARNATAVTVLPEPIAPTPKQLF
jgi:hypothetical protein